MDSATGFSLSENRIIAGQLHARQAHVLRRVPVFMSSLCRVRHGEKLVQWGEQTLRAGPAHLVLMPAGIELGIGNYPGPQGYHAEVLSFSPELLSRFRSNHGALVDAQLDRADTASLCVPLDRHLDAAWTTLMESLAGTTPLALQHHHAQGLLLALSLAGHAGPLLMDRRDRLGARVQQLLLLDPGAPWSVAGVATRLHLGASTLRRQLAQEGRPFRAILEEVRLGVALQRLQTGTRPIGDIAAECGYASASRFAARFRQYYGLSPRDLRAAL